MSGPVVSIDELSSFTRMGIYLLTSGRARRLCMSHVIEGVSAEISRLDLLKEIEALDCRLGDDGRPAEILFDVAPEPKHWRSLGDGFSKLRTDAPEEYRGHFRQLLSHVQPAPSRIGLIRRVGLPAYALLSGGTGEHLVRLDGDPGWTVRMGDDGYPYVEGLDLVKLLELGRRLHGADHLQFLDHQRKPGRIPEDFTMLTRTAWLMHRREQLSAKRALYSVLSEI